MAFMFYIFNFSSITYTGLVLYIYIYIYIYIYSRIAFTLFYILISLPKKFDKNDKRALKFRSVLSPLYLLSIIIIVTKKKKNVKFF